MDIQKLYDEIVDATNDVEAANRVFAVLAENGILPRGHQTDAEEPESTS